MASNDTNTTGLIGGHAQYVKGAAVGAVGSVTGSSEWTQSGEQQKQEAVDAMKSASEDRDPQRDGYGRVEELAGKAAGCEGMEKEGAASGAKTD